MLGLLEMQLSFRQFRSCLAALGLAAATPLAAVELTSEQDVGGQFLIRATVADSEIRRSVYPRFRTELATQGADGQVRKLNLPIELYSEVRTYQPSVGDEAGASYERAYARMVESGDCRPVAAGFREASFDCGAAKGYRTVAVRQDSMGTYFSWESTATAQIPDRAAFDRALAALDDLTGRLIEQAEQEPARR
jgi:hypothetical protein